MMFVPDSWGVELEEFNRCHNPKGPGGGQFCSKKGWAKVPAEQRMLADFQKAREERQAGKMPAGHQNVTPSFMSPGDRDRTLALLQKGSPEYNPKEALATLPLGAKKTLQELTELGPRANAEFSALFDQMMTEVGGRRADFKETISRSAEQDRRAFFVQGPIKGSERLVQKGAADYGGDLSKVKDLVRGTIAFDTVQQAQVGFQKILKIVEGLGGEVQPPIKDLYAQATANGYHHILFWFRLPGTGAIAEIQVNTKRMFRVKETVGHPLYEEERGLYVQLDKNPRDKGLQYKLLSVIRRQFDVYHKAYVDTGGILPHIRPSRVELPKWFLEHHPYLKPGKVFWESRRTFGLGLSSKL